MDQYKKEQIKGILNVKGIFGHDEDQLIADIEDILDHNYQSNKDIIDQVRYWANSMKKGTLFEITESTEEINIRKKQ